MVAFLKFWVFIAAAVLCACGDNIPANYAQVYERLWEQWGAGAPPTEVNLWLDSVEKQCTTKTDLAERLACLQKAMPWPQDSTNFSLWPHQVLQNQAGQCVSLSFLALLALERLNIVANPVALPGHVFIAVPDLQRNWEPNLQGYNHPFSYYAQNYALDSSQGRWAQSLSVAEFKGLVLYEMANAQAQWKDPPGESAERKQAVKIYREAQKWWQDERIAGNLALLQANLGNISAARRILDSLWESGYRSAELERNREALP